MKAFRGLAACGPHSAHCQDILTFIITNDILAQWVKCV